MNIHKTFAEAMDGAGFVLSEAAACERLRRMEEITLHPSLFNTPLIYNPRDQLDLDGSAETQSDSMEDWVEQMLILHRRYKMKILGGCCGTDNHYLSRIVEGIQKDENPNA